MKRLFFILFTLFICTTSAEASRFAVCATTCTWDGSSTAMWSTTSGGATGASVPVITDDVVIDAATCVGGTTCTITVNTSFSINTLTITSCNASTTGCILDFSVNNNNVTIQNSYSDSGTNNAKIKFGSAIINIVATGGGQTAWSHATSGVTFTPGTSVINISGTLAGARTFTAGNGSYATLNILANSSGGFLQFSGGTATFANLNVSGPNNVTWGSGNTVSTSLSLSGTSSSQVLLQSAPGSGSQVTILGNPTVTAAWAGFRDIAFANSVTAANSMDYGDNSNISFAGGAGGGGGCILGGWLLWRDFDPAKLNDNYPAFLDKAG